MPSIQLPRSTRQRAGRKTTSSDELKRRRRGMEEGTDSHILTPKPKEMESDGAPTIQAKMDGANPGDFPALPRERPQGQQESPDEHEKLKLVGGVGQSSGSASEAPPSPKPAPPVSGSDPPVALLSDGAAAPPAAPTEPTGVPALGGDVTPQGRLAIGVMSLIGKRRALEDAYQVAIGFIDSPADGEPAYDFFGVYDGDGGSEVATVWCDNLHLVLAEEVEGLRQLAGQQLGEVELWHRALALSFDRLDQEMEFVVPYDTVVGSTAIIAVVGMESIIIANCGNGKAVLGRNGMSIPVPLDHKPNRPDELQRIIQSGVRVINWNGNREFGALAITQGNYFLKPYVSAEPEVTVIERTEKDEFLILATDGLWEVVSNEAACRIVRRCLERQLGTASQGAARHPPALQAAALLARLAVARDSKDNVTVMVLQLSKLEDGGLL